MDSKPRKITETVQEGGHFVKKAPAPDLAIPTEYKLTKSHAQRILRNYFLGAQMKVRTTPEDVAAGLARWQVWFKGSYGAERALVEVVGPPETMTKACVGASLRRLGLSVDYVHVPAKVGPGTWGIRISPEDKKEAAPPESEAAEVPAPTAA